MGLRHSLLAGGDKGEGTRIDKVFMSVVGCIKIQFLQQNYRTGKYEKNSILCIGILDGFHFFFRMYRW